MTTARALAAILVFGQMAAVPAGAAGCSMGIVNVVFGVYNTLSASSLDGAGSVSVTCDVTSSFQIALNKGQGSFAARQLQSGANVLYYNLYTDALRSLIWGDGTVGTTLASGSGTAATYTVYGRVPGGQNLPVGSYSDSITVTLNF
jgi:spore coat protein U-like protein